MLSGILLTHMINGPIKINFGYLVHSMETC
jgi:hypothetical protein